MSNRDGLYHHNSRSKLYANNEEPNSYGDESNEDKPPIYPGGASDTISSFNPGNMSQA